MRSILWSNFEKKISAGRIQNPEKAMSYCVRQFFKYENVTSITFWW